MERVDHVHVAQIGGRRLVCEVDRMLERDIPDREGLELRISGMAASFILMIELRQACRHLSAAGSGCGDDDERTCGFDIVVSSVAVVAYDQRYI